jgi:hypothetical protein
MNGWKVFDKRKGGGKLMDKYKNRMVVVVTDSQNSYLYMSDNVWQAMGKPEHINVMTRGSNVGLASSQNGEGYKTQRHNEGDTPYLALTKFFKEMNLQPGVYDVHMEAGGVAVFDSQGTPSKA